MPNKKLMLLTMVITCILAVSAVSAEDNVTFGGIVGSDNDGQIIVEGNGSDEGSFDELKTEIGHGGVLNLTRDYLHGGSTPWITISSPMTIDGKGHSLDGNSMSRIFSVDADNVTFRDIAFVNGGDIYWRGNHGILINCSFVNCSVGYAGGAVRWLGDYGSVIDCSFVNCSTTDSNPMFRNGGGAIACSGKDTSISGCSFVNCSSYYGGAVNGGIVFDCNFFNCSAYSGGAVSGNAVYNCSFLNCYSDFGGALSCDGRYSNVYNCSFANCSSTYKGGAIMWNVDYGSVVNCSFEGCSADGGGAIYWNVDYSPVLNSHEGVILNCSFEGCSARENGGAIEWDGENATVYNSGFVNCSSNHGGAIYGGSAKDCSFAGNSANEGNNWYGTSLPKINLSVSDFTSTCRSGEAMFLNATDENGVGVDNVSITIRVYNKDTLIGTYDCLTNTGWLVDLDAGSYTADMAVEHDSYELTSPVRVTLTIAKMPSSAPSLAVCKIGKFLVSVLKDITGKVIAGIKSVAALNIECVKPDFKVVVKITPKMTVKVKTFKFSLKTKFCITLKTKLNKVIKGIEVTVKVKNKTYSAKTNSKGVATFKITKLTKKGKYTATVTYKGGSYYKKLIKKVKITFK